jgi:hypothetical protein
VPAITDERQAVRVMTRYEFNHHQGQRHDQRGLDNPVWPPEVPVRVHTYPRRNSIPSGNVHAILPYSSRAVASDEQMSEDRSQKSGVRMTPKLEYRPTGRSRESESTTS